MADGLASSVAAVFNAFPQISFSQNVGLVALTGMASRYVVAIGGLFLVIAGLLPKRVPWSLPYPTQCWVVRSSLCLV